VAVTAQVRADVLAGDPKDVGRFALGLRKRRRAEEQQGDDCGDDQAHGGNPRKLGSALSPGCQLLWPAIQGGSSGLWCSLARELITMKNRKSIRPVVGNRERQRAGGARGEA